VRFSDSSNRSAKDSDIQFPNPQKGLTTAQLRR